jgi:uncharacterized membrane protein
MSEQTLQLSNAATAHKSTTRVTAIDRLRGFVIVVMAIDHVRYYFYEGAFTFDPLDPTKSDLALYLTRWITHLCAPTFVFLAGVSVFFQAERGKTAGQLARSLLSRGVWLVLLELTVISFAWSFSIPYWLFLQVIWAIGWSMLALAALVWLPRRAVLAIGLVIVFGHNLLDPLTPEQFGSLAWLWHFLHVGGPIVIDGTAWGELYYPVLPWIGIMALGYGMGPIFAQPQEQRDRTLIRLGIAMILLFLGLRALNVYGDPIPWVTGDDALVTAMHFLNVHKYPPSLDYTLVFLGIAFLLLPLLGRLKGGLGRVLETFGAVPFFFYILHLYLAHGLAIAINAALGRKIEGLFDFIQRIETDPAPYATFGFDLLGSYLAWFVVVALLYPLCRWYAEVKRTQRKWWMYYL